ncbi:hypothetical protein [Bremerella sp. P1]|uniref:hypothetical protein n=1 Tax=Bremerella sp. P1 TaxID=3026424 RepID=UPI0023679FF4|nr:hypothetical protein [Bremerella sp. P1]WDI40230.1 hypothetical protein PSR63_17255 [Bremerella sp. P1]
MNPYAHTRKTLFADPHSAHGENAWLLAILNMGEQLDVTTNGNPFVAVCDDLESRGISPNALARVRQMLNTQSQRREAR